MERIYVEQIATMLRRTYSGDWQDAYDDDQNLSRLLARFAIDHATGFGAEVQIEITDGADDKGIDCLAVDGNNLVVLVQSKWKKDGSGSLDLAGMSKMLNGARALIGMKSSLPAQCSAEMRDRVNDALVTPGARLLLVTIATGKEPLSDEVLEPLNEFLGTINISERHPMASHAHLALKDIYDAALAQKKQPVDFDITLLGWGKTSQEPSSYYGRVSGLELAQQFSAFGTSLFSENIRVVLPKSEINEAILSTIRRLSSRVRRFDPLITEVVPPSSRAG
jgi:hypothetical protein